MRGEMRALQDGLAAGHPAISVGWTTATALLGIAIHLHAGFRWLRQRRRAAADAAAVAEVGRRDAALERSEGTLRIAPPLSHQPPTERSPSRVRRGANLAARDDVVR